MHRRLKMVILLVLAVLILGGCSLRTVDKLYCRPKRSQAEDDLQAVINKAMLKLNYSAPLNGENLQAVQQADLDGDGIDEYLLFASDNSEKPLKILIFCQLASGYVLMDTIEGYGFAFDFVEYAQMDNRPGLEIIVGRQVSNELIRSVSVYRFTSGFSRLLVSSSYSRMMTSDLNEDGIREMVLLNPGESAVSKGTATFYGFKDDQMQRLAVANLSESMADVQLMKLGLLQDGVPAVYVTSISNDHSLVTDIFALQNECFSNVTDGIRTGTLHNYYVYPQDIDGDTILELASLIKMPSFGNSKKYFMGWYSVDRNGTKTDKLFTYHNFADGWYFVLEKEWLKTMSVVRTEDACIFYMWDEEFDKSEIVMEIYTQIEQNREKHEADNDSVVLYKGDTVTYIAHLEESAQSYGLTAEQLSERFHMMRAELNTKED